MNNNYTNNYLIYQNEELDTEIGSFDILNRYLKDKDYTYELIEDEIDIQSIRELLMEQLKIRKHNDADIYMLGEQINVLTRAIKQLDNKINK